MKTIKTAALTMALASILSCSQTRQNTDAANGNAYAQYFEILDTAVVSISPYDGVRDTLPTSCPYSRIICMSSTYIAYLDAVGEAGTVCGVSGIGYVSNSTVQQNYAVGNVLDVGYDPSLNYEGIVRMKPDLFVTYKLSASDPASVAKLKSLGIKVLMISDQLESHPLARAEYIRLFGALTGKREMADSVFDETAVRYNTLAENVAKTCDSRGKVLMNVPYEDAWYIPNKGSYMYRLVSDAGGELLGAGEGQGSTIVNIESAYMLARDADFWLHTGAYDEREALLGSYPVFKSFNIDRIYNNDRRKTPGGGNDYYESGAACPDLILNDLVSVLHPGESADSLYYYGEVL